MTKIADCTKPVKTVKFHAINQPHYNLCSERPPSADIHSSQLACFRPTSLIVDSCAPRFH